VIAETSLARLSQRPDRIPQSGALGKVCSLDGEVGLADHLGGTARSKKADIVLDQAFGKVEQACLVVDR